MVLPDQLMTRSPWVKGDRVHQTSWHCAWETKQAQLQLQHTRCSPMQTQLQQNIPDLDTSSQPLHQAWLGWPATDRSAVADVPLLLAGSAFVGENYAPKATSETWAYASLFVMAMVRDVRWRSSCVRAAQQAACLAALRHIAVTPNLRALFAAQAPVQILLPK